MRFNPKARLDTSRMRDEAGGGLGFVLIVVVILLLKACGGVDLTGAVTGGDTTSGYSTSRFTGDNAAYQSCTTGQDANQKPETCGLVAVENSLNDYWQQA